MLQMPITTATRRWPSVSGFSRCFSASSSSMEILSGRRHGVHRPEPAHPKGGVEGGQQGDDEHAQGPRVAESQESLGWDPVGRPYCRRISVAPDITMPCSGTRPSEESRRTRRRRFRKGHDRRSSRTRRVIAPASSRWREERLTPVSARGWPLERCCEC